MSSRKYLAAALGASLLIVNAPSAHAYSGEIDPLDAQCRTDTALANQGKELPDVERYFFGSNQSNIHGNTLKVYNTTAYGEHLKEAMDAWIKATGGLLRVEYVDHRDPEAVTLELGSLPGITAGRQQGTPGNNPRVTLNESLYANPANVHHASMVMTIAHEMGHAMGLAHSCSGALMKNGTNRGELALLPQKLDVQILLQTHPQLRELGGQPMTSEAPEPAEETSAEPEPSVEPEPSETFVPETSAPETTEEPEPTVAPEPSETAAPETTETSVPSPVATTTERTPTELPPIDVPKPATMADAEQAVEDYSEKYQQALADAKAAEDAGDAARAAELQQHADRYLAAFFEAADNRDALEAELKASSEPTSEATSEQSKPAEESTPAAPTTTTAKPVASKPQSTTSAAETPTSKATNTAKPAPKTTAVTPKTSVKPAMTTQETSTTSAKASTTVAPTTTTATPVASKPQSMTSTAETTTSKATNTAKPAPMTTIATPKATTERVSTTTAAKPITSTPRESTAEVTDVWASTSTQASATAKETSPTVGPVDVAEPAPTETRWPWPALPERPTSETTSVATSTSAAPDPTEDSTATTQPTVTTTPTEPADTQDASGSASSKREGSSGGTIAAIVIPLVLGLAGILGLGWAWVGGLIPGVPAPNF